jgi:phage/plasmid-like protein (TIGR03299 family)
MTKETMEWLWTTQLRGFKAKRGAAWHYNKANAASVANHFDGPVPVERIRELFGFTVDKQPLFTLNAKGELFQIEGKCAIVPNDANQSFFEPTEGYEPHQLEPFIDRLSKLTNGSTAFGSAGLLENRAIAYLQIETPENFKTRMGIAFRPFILATTSFNGSISSLFKACNQVVECDNTREAALSEASVHHKVKHTKNSQPKLETAAAALQMLEQTAEAFDAETTSLCQWDVTEAQFQAFLAKLVPLPKDKGRGRTMAETKLERISQLYHSDSRCDPHGTAWACLQAVNTYNHHDAGMRGTDDRAERNMVNVLKGKFASADVDALKCLELVCA